jgi:hypothetical protein
MSPLALNILIRSRVIALRDNALAPAKLMDPRAQNLSAPQISQVVRFDPPQIPTKLEYRPRPIMVLPSNSNFARRLMRRLGHRPH